MILNSGQADDAVFEGASFTQDWFSARSAWSSFLEPQKNIVMDYLEVGSFEGRSLLYASNLFPNAKLTCIDTFEGSDEHSEELVGNLEARFLQNIAPIMDRVTILKGTSLDRLADISTHTEKYDIIYIDGSHFYRHVLLDSLMAWPLLKVGGVLIWDDYAWKHDQYQGLNPKPAIDHFLTMYASDYEVIFVTNQVAIRKGQSESRYFQ